MLPPEDLTFPKLRYFNSYMSDQNLSFYFQYVINYSFPLTVEDYVHRIGKFSLEVLFITLKLCDVTSQEEQVVVERTVSLTHFSVTLIRL
jgi:hypothetical protein